MMCVTFGTCGMKGFRSPCTLYSRKIFFAVNVLRFGAAYFPFVNGRCHFNGRCHHWQPLVMTDVLYSLDEVTIKQTIRFWIVLERTTLKPKLNLRTLWNGLGPPVIDVLVKKDSLLVYVLNFFGILVGRCGSVVASRASDRSRKKRQISRDF